MPSLRKSLTPLVQVWRSAKDDAFYWQGRTIAILRRIFLFGVFGCVIPMAVFGIFGEQFLDNYGQGGIYAFLSLASLFLSIGIFFLLCSAAAFCWPLRKSLERDKEKAAQENAIQVEPRWGLRSSSPKEGPVGLLGHLKRIAVAVIVVLLMTGGLVFGGIIVGDVALDLFQGPRVVQGAICLGVESEQGKTNGGRRNPFPREPYVQHIFTLKLPDQEVVTLRARVIRDRSDRTVPETILDSCRLGTPFTLTYYPHSSVLVNAE